MRGSLFLLGLVLIWPPALLAQTDSDVLYVSATLTVNWTQKIGIGTAEGEMKYTVSGVIDINKQFASNTSEHGLPPIDLWYKNGGLTASYTFDEKVTADDADCPNPIRELHGGGPIKVPKITPGVLDLRYFGTLKENTGLGGYLLPGIAADIMQDHYMLVLAAGPAEAHGTQTYKDGDECKKRKISIDFSPKIQAHFLMNSDGSISGGDSWSSSQRDFQVIVSNMPPSMGQKPTTPSTPADADNKVSYKVSWKVKEPPFVTINSMNPTDPTDPGENITDQSREISIGEKVTLEAHLYPLPEEADRIRIGSWTIPGDILKRWDASKNNSKPIELEDDEFDKSRIEFYWQSAAQDGDSHKIVFTPKKDCDPAETTFEVKRPEIGLTIFATQINSFRNIVDSIPDTAPNCCHINTAELQQLVQDCKTRQYTEDQSVISNLAANYTFKDDMWHLCTGVQYDGIFFEAQIPEDVPGEIEYVQLLSYHDTHDYLDRMDNRHTQHLNSNTQLDTCYPYPILKPPLGTYDTPAFQLLGPGFKTIHNNFEMYLMYRPKASYPEGHEWVPIKMVPWNWGATLDCTIPPPSNPQEDSSWSDLQCSIKDESFPPKQPAAKDIDDYPIWNSCAGNETD